MSNNYLAYPDKDSLIQHNGLPVKFITGSNINGIFTPDILIHRSFDNDEYRGVSYPANIAENVSAAYSNFVSDSNNMYIPKNAFTTISTKVGTSAVINKSDPKFPLDTTASTAAVITATTIYYPDNVGNDYYFGIKFKNLSNITSQVDITNHLSTNACEVLKYNLPNATSLEWAMNDSNYSAIKNVYGPNVQAARGWCYGGIYTEGPEVFENIYLPKAIGSGTYFTNASDNYRNAKQFINFNMLKEIVTTTAGLTGTYVDGFSAKYAVFRNPTKISNVYLSGNNFGGGNYSAGSIVANNTCAMVSKVNMFPETCAGSVSVTGCPVVSSVYTRNVTLQDCDYVRNIDCSGTGVLGVVTIRNADEVYGVTARTVNVYDCNKVHGITCRNFRSSGNREEYDIHYV